MSPLKGKHEFCSKTWTKLARVDCYVAITQEIKAQSSKAATTQIATKLSSTKSYPAQTIDPIILHINFCEDRKHCFIKMFRKSQLKRA